MSDGDRAAPGHRGSDDSGDKDWLTPQARASLHATPWERGPVSNRAAHPSPGAGGTDGNHTDGISVADLIAKVGPVEGRPSTRHRRAEPELEAEAAAPIEPEFDTAPTPNQISAYADELPELRSWDEETTALRVADRFPPARIAATLAPAEPVRKRRHPFVIAGRILVAGISVLALLVTGGAWQWSTSKNGSLRNIAALDPDSRDIIDPNAQFGDVNFLIVGVDSRFGENADMGAGDTSVAGGTRSDTIMLVNIPASRERVVAVSFPRDLDIQPMLCDAWDPETGEYKPVYNPTTGSYGPEEWYTETKLNSAYAYGGPKCLVKVIQKLSGLSINRFIAVDFAGFAKMVDQLGGVDVCSTTPIEDYELGTVLAEPGWQKVDGTTALKYVRARKVTTEINGDYGRIKRQQLFLSSLLRSMISKEVFFSLSKLNNFVNTFVDDSYVDNIQTKDLVQLGQSLQNVAAGRITFLTVPTTGYADEYGNEHMREQDAKAIFQAIIDDDPLPGENDHNETAVPSSTANAATAEKSSAETPQSDATTADLVKATTTQPDKVTVHVSNATSNDGLARTAASELQQQGFNVLTPDDYPSTLSATTVFFSSGNEEAAATVASSLPNPHVERVPGMGNIVQVVLGPDFSTVSSPPPSGSSVQVEVTDDNTSTPSPLPHDLTLTNAADVTCE